MDPSLGFAQLLGIAQGNQTDKTISSKQLARKREQKREKGKIAPNVKKFLEKKEAEERRKRIEKKLELERLNEARTSADKNKINKHLKVQIFINCDLKSITERGIFTFYSFPLRELLIIDRILFVMTSLMLKLC